MVDESVVLRELGEAGLARVVSAFYRRVPNDDILGPMYAQSLGASSEHMEHAEGRLRDFVIFRFGGSTKYVDERGHPRLRARHMPFVIDERGARRWLALMSDAMDECAVAGEARRVLDAYFEHTAMFMVNRAGA